MNFLVRMVAALSAMAAHLCWSQSQRAAKPCSGICRVSASQRLLMLRPSRLSGHLQFGMKGAAASGHCWSAAPLAPCLPRDVAPDMGSALADMWLTIEAVLDAHSSLNSFVLHRSVQGPHRE